MRNSRQESASTYRGSFKTSLESRPFFIGTLFFNTCISLVKMSALLFYSRIFKTTQKLKNALWMSGALVWCSWIVWIVLDIVPCNAFQKVQKNCIPKIDTILCDVILDVVVDVVILLLPMPMVLRLRLKTPKKIALAFEFMLSYG